MNHAFLRWGLPRAMRFDNGLPWGSNSDIPSALSLHWQGLDIAISFGRPARSTDNACVERTHQLVVNWAEPENHTQETWQGALDWATTLQREDYPYDKERRSRIEHFGETLLHSGRVFTENSTVDMKKVEKVLTPLLFARSVGKNGQITVLRQRIGLSRLYAKKTVLVRYEQQHWCVFDSDMKLLKKVECKSISQENLQRGFYHPHRYYQNSNCQRTE